MGVDFYFSISGFDVSKRKVFEIGTFGPCNQLASFLLDGEDWKLTYKLSQILSLEEINTVKPVYHKNSLSYTEFKMTHEPPLFSPEKLKRILIKISNHIIAEEMKNDYYVLENTWVNSDNDEIIPNERWMNSDIRKKISSFCVLGELINTLEIADQMGLKVTFTVRDI